MHDIHVVAGINRHTNAAAQQPVVGQRLGPERIHFEMGHHAGGTGGGYLTELLFANAQNDKQGEGKACCNQIFLFFHGSILIEVCR